MVEKFVRFEFVSFYLYADLEKCIIIFGSFFMRLLFYKMICMNKGDKEKKIIMLNDDERDMSVLLYLVDVVTIVGDASACSTQN